MPYVCKEQPLQAFHWLLHSSESSWLQVPLEAKHVALGVKKKTKAGQRRHRRHLSFSGVTTVALRMADKFCCML